MSEWPTEQEYKYYLHGVKTEQERIIKLLEELDFVSIVIRDRLGKIKSEHGINAGSYESAQTLVNVYCHKSDLIALIKGGK